ncbi:MAG: hypothetical protein A2445_03550 [Candidatus Jacksonbacteria bacterium RIFOXYC2_FULL_44_29]|nr:MAG: hypothetical protein UW45_C0031G0007 [Parcubacteria group bacterium GW2011_GWC2_44_22]OGY75471.1 MAG: hypothetical protein A2240_03075 [Candidatus Jacksonbacteria bacterium RIFOXYA2_FULL_43_12]OGY76966.1 MAG: hypothetical protein A2295_01185 [Candidatus Jacksonbacteria bacterium RIFOXYB2_FULL_44_15]OGY79126.1 MAG: hypothetical protein A2550_01445 [Candidatus Jacksonbacteria bacterium RIFOXYD2_FULL_43_21]OGY80501.1 MAG: hypothetical protein A2445_03550 [Candidatus Jacksonbacteria bacteri
MQPASKEKFLKTYANLPLSVREEIIAVLDDGKPITWNVVFMEVDNNTALSQTILAKLEKLEII